jgi:hypothetical protein
LGGGVGCPVHKHLWVTLAYQKSTSSCIDNFRYCLSINKNGRIIRFQWMNQTTKRKART